MSKPVKDFPSLSQLLPPQRIVLDVQAADWREATRIAGALLVQDHVVNPEYIEAMIVTAEELGPYIVIAPGIAMPHARPEAGALLTGMSLVKLAQPINFGNPDHDPVTLVFALAAVDKQIHIRALQALAELLISDELVQRLMAAHSVQNVQAVFSLAERVK